MISLVDFPIPQFYTRSTRSPLVPHRLDFLASLKLLFFVVVSILPPTSAGFCFGLSFPRHNRWRAVTVFPAHDSLRLGLLFFLVAGLSSSLHGGTTLGNCFEEHICFPVSRAPTA
jgi:hypothetical protein